MKVRDIGPIFGSEVDGVDLSQPLDEDTARELRDLFDRRGVLLFRDVDVDLETQHRLCATLIGDDTPASAGESVERFISNVDPEGLAPFGRLMFHVDAMWVPEPFQVLSLYAADVAPGSATTTFASAVHAWETLPDELRARIEGLHVRQIAGQVRSRGGDDLLDPDFGDDHAAVMPITRRHPRTGATVLYVSQQMTKDIVELGPEEGEELLQELFAHMYHPSVLVEHEWRTGDLVVFDNLALQHARGNVAVDGPARRLRKVMLPMSAGIAAMSKPQYTSATAR
jgi:alpha-ketoglutarate-dependent taurine dioxygenase